LKPRYSRMLADLLCARRRPENGVITCKPQPEPCHRFDELLAIWSGCKKNASHRLLWLMPRIMSSATCFTPASTISPSNRSGSDCGRTACKIQIFRLLRNELAAVTWPFHARIALGMLINTAASARCSGRHDGIAVSTASQGSAKLLKQFLVSESVSPPG
jgi:hypothetical protein